MEKTGRLCVFCGSNYGQRPAYRAAAEELGRELVRRGQGLVFGGGRVGLMGTVADAVLAAGGEAVGVIPEVLVEMEVAHQGLTELHVVENMHQRKALMAELSDGFVALPGGVGTYEELFEVLTWSQLRIHAKPCGVLDVEGYYGPLRALFENALAEGFVRPENRALLVVEERTDVLLDRLLARPPGDGDPRLAGKG